MYVKKEGLTIFTAFLSLPSVHNATKPKFFWVVTDTIRLKSTCYGNNLVQQCLNKNSNLYKTLYLKISQIV